MADWSLIETTLETWVNSITGLPTYWLGRPMAPTFSNAGYALLSISARRTRGVDEIVVEYDDTQPAGSEIRTYQMGQRVFTFGVQIRTQRRSVDNDAKHYTSLLHDSLRMPQKTVAVLAEADIAVALVLAETDIEETLDGRDLSISQLDIRMNAKSVLEDTKIGYIQTLTDLTVEIPEGTPVWTGDIQLS